jgi:hypothetical protein
MGYLTTFTIKNDALHVFEKHPKEFAEALFEAMRKANRSYRAETIGFQNYGGYIESQPSFHADEHQLYVHSGNCVFNLNPWRRDFEDLLDRSPDVAENFVKRADSLLKECKKKIKERKAKNDH